ncbi:MAG: glycogen debranching enzyme N-terminal domain-containing protein [Bacteroidales bacterium]|nr:glycogen debranching enzyme N-terminal domain-containing protein [Bacteroidales bacterium]MCL2133189.1 glycogen debranching enzyme N-terminal domain-containing protein [Bacteroidales bacterium]
MAYLKFNKAELVNLAYSLRREILATNRAGGYTNTTIVCCNTRKYHGLLVVPIDEFQGDRHVLLSALDETVIQHGQAFNLGIHHYRDAYEPRGHKYIVDFAYEPVPTLTYRVGGVLLKKEMMLVHNEDQLLIRYTLLDAHSATTLRLKPYLAYRNVHELTKANMTANTRSEKIPGGVKSKLYNGFPTLHMQMSKSAEFVACPDWYYNIEYMDEVRRGYDGMEDLFVPGYFECSIKKGESIIFSASVKEAKPTSLKTLFGKTLAVRPPRNSYIECLTTAAGQFISQRGKLTELIAGFPFYGQKSRDTLVSLPGLTLAANRDEKMCKTILDNMSQQLYEGWFTDFDKNNDSVSRPIDAPLWYCWAVQQYAAAVPNANVWKLYGKKMKAILEAYSNGSRTEVCMHDNGLLWSEEQGKPLNWMDAVVNGKSVSPRIGYQVEVNALWYNALSYVLELAEQHRDTKFVKQWEPVREKTAQNFLPIFWSEERNHLADYVGPEGQNIFYRPNQILACALPYSPLSDETKQKALAAIEHELLTPKGLRTLSPRNPLYIGRYEGNQTERYQAQHQGTVYPWLLSFYIEANFRLYGRQFAAKAKELIAGFEEDMMIHGLCTISELYHGDPPHSPHGCIAQASSVAAILRSMHLIEQYGL